MFTYIFKNSYGAQIAQRQTDVEVGINGFINFENNNYRVSPSASSGKTLICTPVHSTMIKYDPAVELVEFFKTFGIDHLTPMSISEEAAKEAFLSLMSPWFEVEREVSGVLTKLNKKTTKLRIDAILTPKVDEHTKRFNNFRAIPFGIEFKDPRKFGKGSGGSLSEVLAQCTDYATCDFKEHGHIPVFAFPFFNHRAHVELLNYTAKSQVGVITTHYSSTPYFAFRLGEMAVWDSLQGFTDLGQKGKLERKYGNRS